MNRFLLSAACSLCVLLASCAAHVQSFSFERADGRSIGLTERPSVNPDNDGMLLPGAASGPRYTLNSPVRAVGTGNSFYIEYDGEEPGASVTVYGHGTAIAHAVLPDLPDMTDVFLDIPVKPDTQITGMRLFAPAHGPNSGVSAAGYPITGIQINGIGITRDPHAFYSKEGVGVVAATGSATPGSTGASVHLEDGVVLSHDGREVDLSIASSLEGVSRLDFSLMYRDTTQMPGTAAVLLQGEVDGVARTVTRTVHLRPGEHTISFGTSTLGFAPRRIIVRPGTLHVVLTRLDLTSVG